MNYLVLSEYDSMDTSDALVITKDNMYHLSDEKKYYLMSSDKCWFDMDKVKEYIKDLNLLPCTVIHCIDGEIIVNNYKEI